MVVCNSLWSSFKLKTETKAQCKIAEGQSDNPSYLNEFLSIIEK